MCAALINSLKKRDFSRHYVQIASEAHLTSTKWVPEVFLRE
jgi:hypothetical protein